MNGDVNYNKIVIEHGEKIAKLEAGDEHIIEKLDELVDMQKKTRQDIHDFRNISAHAKDVLEAKEDIEDLKQEVHDVKERISLLEKSKKSIGEFLKLNIKDVFSGIIMVIFGLWCCFKLYDSVMKDATYREAGSQTISAHYSQD